MTNLPLNIDEFIIKSHSMKKFSISFLLLFFVVCFPFAIASETIPIKAIRSYQFIKDYTDNSKLSSKDFKLFSPEIQEYLGIQENITFDAKGFSRRLESGEFLFVSTYNGRFGPVSRGIVIKYESLYNHRKLVPSEIAWDWRPLFLPRFDQERIPYSVPYVSDEHAELIWNEQYGGLQETYCLHSFNDRTKYYCLKYLYKLTNGGVSFLMEMHGRPFNSQQTEYWVPLWKQGKWQVGSEN